MSQDNAKQRNERKAQWLAENGGLCAVCHTGPFCPACHYGLEHKGGACFTQPVNTYDHNHNRGTAHYGCKGCAQCFRGVTHKVCNRGFLPIAERSPYLQSEYVKEYLAKGEFMQTYYGVFVRTWWKEDASNGHIVKAYEVISQ